MEDGHRVTHLLHFRNIKRPGSHELNPEIIQAQSEAIGVPLIQRDFHSYEDEFKKVIIDLRSQGVRIDGAVFGHIETHKQLVDRICNELNIDLLIPLWKKDSEKTLMDILDSGFEVVIVSSKNSLMGTEWLGRKIDRKFISDLKRYDTYIDPCGENSEFHTIVTDGPIFNKKIVITGSERILKENYWHLNITGFKVLEK
ncbi:MAG: ATP-binding region [Euryarchaeota archaeon ADurb.Bin294]|jgi:uncharacterized protein (TIGR00290 family)|nr:MAG: ATP-binding region [Euryarchaeota archaeon ADurb.Bin294]